MIKTLKDDYNFRVTLWIHPFINLECPSWYTAATPPQSYMVRDTKGKQEIGRLPGIYEKRLHPIQMLTAGCKKICPSSL
jgi:hypothetical protein